MNRAKNTELYVFIPESSALDPASRTRCYKLAEILARSSHVELLRLHGDPFDFLSLGIQSLWKVLRLFPALRRHRGPTALFVQRGQRNAPKIVALLVLRRLTRSALIFDFDDSVFLTEPLTTNLLCRASDAVTVANSYLAQYALQRNPRVREIPTSIDLDVYTRTSVPRPEYPVIGWTGSPSNLKYLRILETPLEALRRRHAFVFRILTDSRWRNRIPLGGGIPYEVVNWSLDGFVPTLSTFDIGVAPLTDDSWTRGKAGYRILEYMAMGIPPVASKVGENARVVEDGLDGFLVDSPDEWTDRLDRLLSEPGLRTELGAAGRRKVEQHYAAEVSARRLGELLAALAS